MVAVKGKKKVDFTEGPLFWRLLVFAFPIMVTSIIQILYSTADKIVVGQFSGDDLAIGAIGSTTFISGLIINFMIGVGAGVGVLVAQLYGAKNKEETSRAVHSSFIMAFVLSSVLMLIGFITAEPLLTLLNTKEELMSRALLYINITYAGLIGVSCYNVGASILRAVGDSKTPLYIGTASGIINVLLNLLFVIVFKMSIAGVALATIISQYFSAAAVIYVLSRKQGESYQFSFSRLKPNKSIILRVLRLGIPTGLQSCCFSITNLYTSWAVNQFPTPYVAARSIGLDIDHIVSAFSAAFLHSSLNATGQNYGAKNKKRVVRVLVYSLIQSIVVTFVVSWLLREFRYEVAAMFVEQGNKDFEAIVSAAAEWSGVMLTFYFTQGALNAVSGSVRGMGYSVSALLANLIGVCGTRLIWVFFIFPLEEFHSFTGLALQYPASWAVTALLLSVLCAIAFAKLAKEKSTEEPTEAKAEA